ncbi:hypothetical protein ACFXA3_12200 [Streptomyces sp. NPDC059456]|uniref:hypothetical protein n=1 Tax=Streptomyces sp. NPDC059456 TaxID=3346838 RepID=UPI00367ADEE9
MPFEDDLSDALRRTGEAFTPDRHALVSAGEQRGRRLVARRRAAVVGGSVLALAVIGAGSAYTGGLFDAAGTSGGQTVAAPPALPEKGKGKRTGSGAVPADQMAAVFKKLLPKGQLSDIEARGTADEVGPSVSGVYDDGQGKAAIGVSLTRTDPSGRSAAELLKCPDGNVVEHDACELDTLPDGGRIQLFKGYEYPDRREPTKLWRAILVTPEGYQVDVQEWNAPAEKGAKVSRVDPPLNASQLKEFAISTLWRPALGDLPAAGAEPQSPATPPTVADAGVILESLLPQSGLTVTGKGGSGDYGYLVLDDGKGASFVQVNAQQGMGPALAARFGAPDATTLPDGTKVVAEQQPGEKGGANVVMWTVDTLRPNGLRVVISAFNSGNQNKAATRKEPALTMEELRRIALDPKWVG